MKLSNSIKSFRLCHLYSSYFSILLARMMWKYQNTELIIGCIVRIALEASFPYYGGPFLPFGCPLTSPSQVTCILLIPQVSEKKPSDDLISTDVVHFMGIMKSGMKWAQEIKVKLLNFKESDTGERQVWRKNKQLNHWGD